MKDSIFSQYFSRQSPKFFYDVENLPNLRVSCFEGASLDARNFQQLSEDFFAYQYQNNLFCMVLCDGVGQTKDAELAASLFGKKILGYLPTVNGKKDYLEKISYDLRSIISDEIDLAPLSEDAPQFHKRARQNDGAQVKFACCVIDFNKRIIEIYWAGDVRFIVYDTYKKIVKSVSEDNHQFWSTKSSYSLNLEYYSIPIESASRISITSDGVREDINNILNHKMYLDDFDLAKKIYQKGVDDVSGIDVKISLQDNLRHLSAPKNINILGHNLNWDSASDAERYRIYYSSQKKVEFLANIDVIEKAYIIPKEINFDEIFVQTISSNYVSSKLFKPTEVPDPMPDVQLVKGLIDKLPTSSVPIAPTTLQIKDMPKEKIEIQPNRFWLIFSSLIIFVCLSSIVIYSLFPFWNDSGTTVTSTFLVTYTKTKITNNITITPSFTPVFTETITILTETITVLTETPNQSSEVIIATVIPLPDISLLEVCQQEIYLLNPEKYQTSFHQIQPDETLTAIAQTYSISIEDIKEANCLEGDAIIFAGKYLLIPHNP